MAKRDVLRVEWSSDERIFVVLSDESIVAQFSALKPLPDKDNDNQAADHDLAYLIERFQRCLDTHGVSAAVMEMQTLRTRVLMTILDTPTPLKWLPSFLDQWESVLSSMIWGDGVKLTPDNRVEYCRELVSLASGWKVVGDITRARSTLGKCFEVVRRCLKAPFARPSRTESDESQALRHVAVTAKKLLLECVAFHTSLDRLKELFARHEAPPHVLASLTDEFWRLLRQAPLSTQVAALLVHSLMKQRQFDLVTRFLEQSALTGATAELTLVHARALVYAGFYRDSLQIVELFRRQGHDSKEDMEATEPLTTHCSRLRELLAQREQADEFLRRDEFDKAASAYDECLCLVDPADHKHLAALLFGRGNAFMGLEQLPAAIDDLRQSVRLDPANKLASLRLQTACLQLETERIRNELSGTGGRVRRW